MTTTATALEVLHTDYEVWCMQKELTAASMEAFAEEFDRVREVPELAGNIKKRGNRYYGIKLVDSDAGQAPRDKTWSYMRVATPPSFFALICRQLHTRNLRDAIVRDGLRI